MLTSSLLSVIAALPVITAGSSALAGNENYARNARRSLGKQSITKRSNSPTFEPESVSFEINGKQYISPTGLVYKSYSAAADWGLDEYKGSTLPVTVFKVTGEVTCDVLGKAVEKYGTSDDVWDEAFMAAIMLTTDSSFHVAEDVADCLKGWGGSLIVKSGNATSSVKDIGLAHVAAATIPQGPYLAKIGDGVSLTEVYRVYRDEAQAFTSPVIPTTENTFTDLSSPVAGLNTLSIPVPSRLYTMDLPNPRPLEGRRIAVKDLFDMAGLQTGGGSRAYFNTYPAKEVTAAAIQHLVNQGAIIVGRAKTSQFANGETATADWVDQLSPFNPRGDGYQQPSSSSSGPGASIGAYSWLDETIGSDTGGSITGPAGNQGVYGLRPSWGAISLEGAIPLQATQDTAGFFTRDANDGAAFARAMYGDKFANYSSFPSTLIVPNSSWTFDADYAGTEQYDKFRTALTDFLAPSSVDNRSLEGYWNSTGRFEAQNASSSDYMEEVYGNLITYYQWTNFGQPWYEDYAAQHEGRLPFVSPSPLVRWQYGANNVSEDLFNDGLAKKGYYQEFITSDVLIKDDTTCSSAIYAEPANTGSTSYRNLYRSAPSVPFGFGYVAQMSGVPQLVVPIGQVPYESTITNHTEYLPISISLYAAAGCDYMLWDLAAALQNAGIISPVSTGALAYPLTA